MKTPHKLVMTFLAATPLFGQACLPETAGPPPATAAPECSGHQDCLADQQCVNNACVPFNADAGAATPETGTGDAGSVLPVSQDAGAEQPVTPSQDAGPTLVIVPGFDTDGDGLNDDEEVEFGSDCSTSNPFSPDTDDDGIVDSLDPYPYDPWPEFMVRRGATEGIELYLSNRDGSFQDMVLIGQPVVGDPNGEGSEVLLPYTNLAIGDFDHNGKMDFLATTDIINPEGEQQVWLFTRNEKKDEFDQRLIGVTQPATWAIVMDANGDSYFDLVLLNTSRGSNNYVSDVNIQTYINTRQAGANCFAGEDEDTECFFHRLPDKSLSGVASGQWGFRFARQAVNLNPEEDNHLDLTVGTYSSGGPSATKTYTLYGNGDGTFQDPVLRLTHAGNLGPANTMLFADFNNDDIGDVIMGFDDDGSPGSGWFYAGQPGGTLSSTAVEAIDLNPTDARETAGNSNLEHLGRTSSGRTFDFNFDGNYDLIIGYNHEPYQTHGQTRLYLGNGDGTFDDVYETVGAITDYEHVFSVPQRLCPTFELPPASSTNVDGGTGSNN